MVTITFVFSLLVIIQIINGQPPIQDNDGVFECTPTNPCADEILRCAPDRDCIVNCIVIDDDQYCSGMIVKCAAQRKCTINCGNKAGRNSGVCLNAIINGAIKGELEVNSNIEQGIEGSEIRCPARARCIVNCGSEDNIIRGECLNVQIC